MPCVAAMVAALLASGGTAASAAQRGRAKLQWAQVVEQLSALTPTTIPGSHMWAEQLHASPDIYAVHNYLDGAETAELLNLHDDTVVGSPATIDASAVATTVWCWPDKAEADLIRVRKKIAQVPAKVDDSWCLELAPGESPGGAQEVSTSSLFIRGDSVAVDQLERKTTALLALPGLTAYHGQIVRYDGTGAGYKVHTDCHRKSDRFANNRAVSFLIYLLGGSSRSLRGAAQGLGGGGGGGGETVFPNIGVKIPPEAGMAILWNNLDSDGLCDPRTAHASVPLKSGKKARWQLHKKKPKKNKTKNKQKTSFWTISHAVPSYTRCHARLS